MPTVLFGGSFNPVHNGHLRLARAALSALPGAKLLWLPAACSPFKTGRAMAAERHRYAMCALAAAGESAMAVSDAEFSLPAPSYTVQTVEWFLHNRPDEYWFLCGADAFLSLSRWRSPERLVTLTGFAVADRGAGQAALQRQKAAVEAAGGRVLLLPMEPEAVSSSAIRDRLRAGQPITGLVPPAVEQYIRENALYKE